MTTVPYPEHQAQSLLSFHSHVLPICRDGVIQCLAGGLWGHGSEVFPKVHSKIHQMNREQGPR